MTYPDDKLVVGFDLDGVIIDHTQNKIRVAARYGVHLTPEETHSELMWKSVPKDIEEEIRNQIYDDTDEALSAPLMEGAFDALARLAELGVPYFLISRRKKPLHAVHLLERRGLWGHFFTPENAYFVGDPAAKNEVAERLGVTHYIDDETRVLKVMNAVPTKILFDRQDLFPLERTFDRARDWFELGAMLGIATRS